MRWLFAIAQVITQTAFSIFTALFGSKK